MCLWRVSTLRARVFGTVICLCSCTAPVGGDLLSTFTGRSIRSHDRSRHCHLLETRSLATSRPFRFTLSLPAYSPLDTPAPSPSSHHSLPAPATHHRPLSTSHTGAPALSQPHSVRPSPSLLFSHPFPCNLGFPPYVVVVLAALVALPSAGRSDCSRQLPNYSE